ncbi:hypothetical protein [Lignipirellula cremea]|uniref:Kelch motif protein n=1 Tax=Lignipirellula cremea TaxID=2528010 RepID=A0A518DNM7_9BACT|nr:hypothetical protein [Lignipirellula cremea]QDU93436.1 hypothetical protein Pla8534_12160 [Lignipirellula cremea]
MNRIVLPAAIAAVLMAPCCLTAAEPLHDDLERDPAVAEILSSLKPGESAWLPEVKTAGPINEELKKHRHHLTGPRPRNYSLKWVWAADRNRALFCGGNAGTPHKLNDVWEYDLASNTWVLLWEPDPDTNRVRRMEPKEKSEYLDAFVKLDPQSGELMTKRGAPFDPVHTWWALTYDPQLHALLWVMGNHHLHDFYMEQHPELQKDYQYGGRHPMRLWAFYPGQTRWEFFKAPEGLQRSPAAILEYVPELHGSLYVTETHAQSGVFHSESKEWTWEQLARSSSALADDAVPQREAVAAYDAQRKLIVAHHGGFKTRTGTKPKRTWHFDVENSEWKLVLESDEGPVGFDTHGPMVYDSAANACFLVGTDALWRYDAATPSWTKVKPQGPEHINEKRRASMACYNPEFNVIMVDNGAGRVWVYRAANETE